MKLHLGCGPRILNGWVNMDLQPAPGGIVADLTRPLPIGNGSVHTIYSEHFIEHIDRQQAVALLMECMRVLTPGGRLRISTPDVCVLAQDFLAQKTDRWLDVGWAPSTPCQMINGGMREWGHTFVYDEPEMMSVLIESGFAQPQRVSWHRSVHPDLCQLETRPDCGDLIVEAHKP